MANKKDIETNLYHWHFVMKMNYSLNKVTDDILLK